MLIFAGFTLWQLPPFLNALADKARSANWTALLALGVLLAALFLIWKWRAKIWGGTPVATSGLGADEESLHAIFNHASLGIGLLDRNEKLLAANPAFGKLLGYEADELQGAPLSNFAHPEDAHGDKALFDELKAGDRPHYELDRRFYKSDGHLLWLHQEVVARGGSTPAASAPEALGAVLLQDITRRKVAEQELQITREAIHNLYQVIVGRDLDVIEKMGALLAMGSRRFNVESGVIGQIVDNGFEVLQVSSPDERIRRGKVYERSTQLSEERDLITARTHRLRGATGGEAESAHDWRNFPFYSTADVEVFLSAPIRVLDRTFGVLCFSSVTAREDEFTPSDREFLLLMAQWLGGELERLQALAELENKRDALLQANAQLEALATIDGLTGAKNRRAFDEQLEMEFRRSLRYNTPLSLLLLDVDKFKQFNDSFGHLAGDGVLKEVARILMTNVRVIDFVARYGGEEFVVLLPNTNVEGAMILADRLREKIAGAPWDKRDVTASFGVATLNAEIKEGSELTGLADRALYASKEAGRNRCTHIRQLEAGGEAEF
jgi:diguanylate cyclase (GGDEF)-like protein/PAS domain S-box-containing protein